MCFVLNQKVNRLKHHIVVDSAKLRWHMVLFLFHLNILTITALATNCAVEWNWIVCHSAWLIYTLYILWSPVWKPIKGRVSCNICCYCVLLHLDERGGLCVRLFVFCIGKFTVSVLCRKALWPRKQMQTVWPKCIQTFMMSEVSFDTDNMCETI